MGGHYLTVSDNASELGKRGERFRPPGRVRRFESCRGRPAVSASTRAKYLVRGLGSVPLEPSLPPSVAIGERLEGPIFLGHNGERLDRHAAWRIVRRLARKAGINKPVGPHTLRHAFITAALDAGVPLRDVQEAASHADPRTTMRYDRARVSLDRHATYVVAAFLAGAAR
ncbi:MAG: tyrosine-type recombinase/integrase [Acidimicrobiales bacterium]